MTSLVTSRCTLVWWRVPSVPAVRVCVCVWRRLGSCAAFALQARTRSTARESTSHGTTKRHCSAVQAEHVALAVSSCRSCCCFLPSPLRDLWPVACGLWPVACGL